MRREDSLLFAMRLVLAMFMVYLGVSIVMQKEMPMFVGLVLLVMAVCVVFGSIWVIYKLESNKTRRWDDRSLVT